MTDDRVCARACEQLPISIAKPHQLPILERLIDRVGGDRLVEIFC